MENLKYVYNQFRFSFYNCEEPSPLADNTFIEVALLVAVTFIFGYPATCELVALRESVLN